MVDVLLSRASLLAPKDKGTITQKSGVIYQYMCEMVDCDEEYIGESARTFGKRFKEHFKACSPIYKHSNIADHQTSADVSV